MAAEKAPSRPARLATWIVIGAVLVALVAWGAWVGVRGLAAKGELEAVIPAATALEDAARSGDTVRAVGVAGELAEHAARAAELSDDPLWRAAEVLPVLGPNLAAVRVASAQLDALSTHAIQPLLGVSSSLSAARDPLAGTFDPAVVTAARQPLADAARTLETAAAELSAASLTSVAAPLRDGMHRLREQVVRAQILTTQLSDAAAVLPGMLGADGPRSILLVFQNNAELRSGGGITAAFAEVRAEGGALTLVDQAGSRDFPALDEPIMALPESATTLYGDAAGRFVQNISMPADFVVSGRLASEWWNLRTGHRPDLVVSIDPVALQAALAVLGPVDVPGWGPLTGEDAAHRLLVEPYLSIADVEHQDAVFRSASASVFGVLLAGAANPIDLLTALQPSIAEGRVSAWSAHEAEQALLTAGPLGGQAARRNAAGEDAFGVYLKDATGAKMDSFLDVGIATTVSECRADGRSDIVVAVTLTNTAPADAESTLPVSLTGNGIYGVAAGNIGTYVTVSAPPGTFFGAVTRDEGPRHSVQTEADGYAASQARLNLEPGETDTLVFRFVAAEPGETRPTIVHTPAMNPIVVAEPVRVGCGS